MTRLFALAILGAAACTTEGIRPNAAAAPADSADQVMLKMSTDLYSEGARQNFVVAETAYVFQAAQKMDLRQLRIIFFEDGKQTSVLTAKRGLYQVANGSLDATGNVKVVSTDGRTLTTQHLIYDKVALQISSDSAFTYESKAERMTGNRFHSDLEFKYVVTDQPKGVQRSGGVILQDKR